MNYADTFIVHLLYSVKAYEGSIMRRQECRILSEVSIVGTNHVRASSTSGDESLKVLLQNC